MRQSNIIRRWRPWLLLLVLFAWLLPQQAAADTYDTYVDKSYNYGVTLDGSNTVKIHVPVYVQEGADCWIKDGQLKVSVAGGNEITLFRWRASENIDGSADKCWTTFSTEAGGYIMVTLGNTSSTVKVTSGGSVGGDVIQNNDEAETYDVTALWYVPYDVLGKKLTFKWDVERNGNSRDDAKLTLSAPEAITMPSAGQTLQPIISDAMLSTKFKGQIEVPWFLASTDITKIRYEYTDAFNKTIRVDMPTNENNGIIRLNATEPHRDFRIVASYRMKGEGASYYDIENVQSSSENLTMIHAPLGLTATAIDGVRPKVELKWNTAYLTDEDFALTDFFEIQRSLTGEEKDFETIGQEVFAQASKKGSYTFVDSTIVQAIKNGMLKNGGTLDKLTYRVRRAMSQIWGWDQENNCAAGASCIVDNLHLLRIANYSAKWEDERAYTVRVSWDYVNEFGGVWDDRAKMMLHITSKNNSGKVVEDRTIELNKEERNQRYKVVNLSRPCVHYDIEVYVDRDKSPIDYIDNVKSFFFPIRNADDWVEFKNRVQVAGGKSDVNARLYADISTGECISWESGYAYRGIFDGNGHTITFDLADTGQRLSAPFRYAGNATIKNLHTAGTITTSNMNAAGLIANVLEGSTVVIENCRSSVTLKSNYAGESDNGGFVGRVSGANVLIRNSEFDGSFEGDNCYENGGFVGWGAKGSNVVIENCFFAADHIKTKLDKCATWACVEDGTILNVSNSYAVMEYSSYIIIRSAEDWSKFVTMVEEAANRNNVDALLDADISLSGYKSIAGYSGNYAYRGTFDGNGHTITLDISDNAARTGLFSHVGNATFRNLNLKGTVSSPEMWLGSLIGQIDSESSVLIENCHSSVTLKSSRDGDATMGGFVGYIAATNSNLTIRNCKFDGSFEGEKCHSNGGFVGWTNSKVTIENCLFMPDHISTRYNNCSTWTRNASGNLTITNSYANQEYNIFPINSADDWDKFRAMIDGAKGQYWVDAMLTANIDIKQTAAMSSIAPFRGTFYGNGHTITVDINGGSEDYIALFRYGKDYTIKDLNVTGKITGGNYTAGLVGHTEGWDGSSKISNCRVSVEVTSQYRHAGGFCGYGNGVDIVNCRFDGKVECKLTDSFFDPNYAGAFMGWVNNTSVAMAVQSCLEKGSSYEKFVINKLIYNF